jgi:hypothetical protein
MTVGGAIMMAMAREEVCMNARNTRAAKTARRQQRARRDRGLAAVPGDLVGVSMLNPAELAAVRSNEGPVGAHGRQLPVLPG